CTAAVSWSPSLARSPPPRAPTSSPSASSPASPPPTSPTAPTTSPPGSPSTSAAFAPPGPAGSPWNWSDATPSPPSSPPSPSPTAPTPPRPALRALPVGRCEDGTLWLVRLHGTHLLIAGSTGAGKGSVIWGLIRALLAPMQTGLVRVLAADPKLMELAYGRAIF